MPSSQDDASIPGIGQQKFHVFRDRDEDVTSSSSHPKTSNSAIAAGVDSVKPRVGRDGVLQDAGNRQLGVGAQVEKDLLSRPRGNSVEDVFKHRPGNKPPFGIPDVPTTSFQGRRKTSIFFPNITPTKDEATTNASGTPARGFGIHDRRKDSTSEDNREEFPYNRGAYAQLSPSRSQEESANPVQRQSTSTEAALCIGAGRHSYGLKAPPTFQSHHSRRPHTIHESPTPAPRNSQYRNQFASSSCGQNHRHNLQHPSSSTSSPQLQCHTLNPTAPEFQPTSSSRMASPQLQHCHDHGDLDPDVDLYSGKYNVPHIHFSPSSSNSQTSTVARPSTPATIHFTHNHSLLRLRPARCTCPHAKYTAQDARRHRGQEVYVKTFVEKMLQQSSRELCFAWDVVRKKDIIDDGDHAIGGGVNDLGEESGSGGLPYAYQALLAATCASTVIILQSPISYLGKGCLVISKCFDLYAVKDCTCLPWDDSKECAYVRCTDPECSNLTDGKDEWKLTEQSGQYHYGGPGDRAREGRDD
ncbi:hypothetical protein DFH27DRAFT_624020 [Peziza echinospora]|nr:hypothetical protein DFH27DRAFT_624020 [Peziza echinospora]